MPKISPATTATMMTPPLKRTALHTASAELLAPIFPAQFGSVNAEAALAASTRALRLTNAAAPEPPPSIFTPPRSQENFLSFVAGVEDRLRAAGMNQPAVTQDEMGDAVRECLARGELERARTLLSTAGGTLKNSAERRFLDRVWERANAATKGP